MNMFSKKRVWHIALSAVLTAAILIIVWWVVGKDAIERIEFSFNPWLGVAAAALYVLTLVTKTLRFHIFFARRVNVRKLFDIIAVHSFWNNVLPFRLGEFSYLYLLKKENAVGDGENVASLVAARIFDAAVVVLFFVLSSLALFASDGSVIPFFSASGIAVVVLIVGGLFLSIVWHAELATDIEKLAKKLTREGSLAFRVFGKIVELLHALGGLARAHVLIPFASFSLLVWASEFLFIWAALGAAGMHLSPLEAVFITAFPVIAFLLPIQSPLGVGTFEGTLVAGLVLVGAQAADALAASIILHAQFLAFSAFAFLSVWWRRVLHSI